MKKQWLVVGIVTVTLSFPITTFVHAEPVDILVIADKPGIPVSGSMFGVFFEDINFGADGGLYAELVKNRSFEFPDGLMGWKETILGESEGSLSILDNDTILPVQPHYLRITSRKAGKGYGMINEGFRGMGVHQGQEYIFSVYLRGDGSSAQGLQIQLINPLGQSLGKTELKNISTGWEKRTVTLRSNATEAKAMLRVTLSAEGTVDLDMVSLFPKATWKKRPNGLRADLVQWLADLKPGFVRFPGGCIVEGRYLSTRYQWKTTIGRPEDRKLIINRWNDEFKHRLAPDYFQSFGLGFYEYFLLCEDIGAEPLPILNCGMACQFNSGELVPMDQLEPYVQDALDLIEFANGPQTSEWGRKRAEMGHPEPFGMTMLGVGNEQWGPQYIERYKVFAAALKDRYPNIRLVSAAGPSPADDRYHFAWQKLRELNAEIIDEHCYDNPGWFFDHANRYDAFDRKGPKVFMGEYAAQSVKTVSPENRNNWHCAMSEAAFITGLERNADVVVMSSYAPLFGHEELWQWRPNLIWFDNLTSYGTPNYYVQQAFSVNRCDEMLPVEVSGQPPASAKQPGLYVTAGRDKSSGEMILKIVNSASKPIAANLQLSGTGRTFSKGIGTVIASSRLNDENSITQPRNVAPVTHPLDKVANQFVYTCKPYSLSILRIQ
jgi:alpha-L-arabinofuranosidase